MYNDLLLVATSITVRRVLRVQGLIIASIVADLERAMSEQSVQKIARTIHVDERLPNDRLLMCQALVRDKGIKVSVHGVLEKCAELRGRPCKR